MKVTAIVLSLAVVGFAHPLPCNPMTITPERQSTSDYITWVHADDDYIYLLCERCGDEECEDGECWCDSFSLSGGYVMLYDHDGTFLATLESEALLTADTFVNAIASNDDYLYIGTHSGLVVQVDKETLEATGWCMPGSEEDSEEITGIVDIEDSYIYVTIYIGDQQFFKIDPSTMEVVDSLWAPDSTHALASDGRYLYSITCPTNKEVEWGDYSGELDGACLLLVDPVTMSGADIITGSFPEMGQGLAVDGGYCYLTIEDNDIYKVDLGTREVVAVAEDCPSDIDLIKSLHLSGNRLYVEPDPRKSRSNGYAVYNASDLSMIDYVDSDRRVYALDLFDDELYVSYGDEVVVQAVEYDTPTPTPTPTPQPTATPTPPPVQTAFDIVGRTEFRNEQGYCERMPLDYIPEQAYNHEDQILIQPEDNPPFPTDDGPQPLPWPLADAPEAASRASFETAPSAVDVMTERQEGFSVP